MRLQDAVGGAEVQGGACVAESVVQALYVCVKVGREGCVCVRGRRREEEVVRVGGTEGLDVCICVVIRVCTSLISVDAPNYLP